MWRVVVDGYEISIDGQFRNQRTGRVLQSSVAGRGYDYVRVGGAGAKKQPVHRLVARAFLPQPTDECEVDHIDRNKRNNHASNLRWVSRQENMENRSIELMPRSTNTTGHHHIKIQGSKRQRNPSYVVSINTKKWGKHYGCFRSLDEAIDYRDRVINAAVSFEKGTQEGFILGS